MVGGVTENSARVYLRTDVPTNFEIELDTNANFSTSTLVAGSTDYSGFRKTVVDLAGLVPNKQHYFRVNSGGQTMVADRKFRTFPTVGEEAEMKILVGSCNYFDNPELFGHVEDFDPALFLHLGDWNYAPSTFGGNYNLNDSLIAEAFAWKYNDDMMRDFVIPNMAVDYVYDDDYSYNGCEAYGWPDINQVPIGGGEIMYDLITVPMDSGIRVGAINGYFENFPAYPKVDTTTGIHHSIRFGNVEIFMLDLRNSRTAQHDAFVYDAGTNIWSFDPPADHTIMGASQRQWLLDGLANSTADWKFIGSSVIYNERFKQFFEIAMQLQVLNPQLVEYASDMAYFWHAYPHDVQALKDVVAQNNIKDVIILSGDSHSSMIDDGTNAGFPELSASGFASEDEGFFNHSLDSVIDLLGYDYGVIDSLWNHGGNALNGFGFNDSYGTLEIFGGDSVRMCAVNEHGENMGCLTVLHSTIAGISERENVKNTDFFTPFPNPTRDQLSIKFDDGFVVEKRDRLDLISPDGKLLQTWSGSEIQNASLSIDLRGYPAGNYLLNYIRDDQITGKQFTVAD